MVPHLRPSPAQLRDLGEIQDIGREPLQAVLARLSTITSTPLRAEDLLEVISDVLRDSTKAEALLRQLLGLVGVLRQKNWSATEVVERLRLGLERSGKWDHPEGSVKWTEVEPLIARLLELDAVQVVQKALELSYDYANLYQHARILTDIRPLYDAGATKIDASIVSFTLRLRFDSSDGNHGLSIALDERDVVELRRQCERALKKASIARELMTTRGAIPTVIAGENDDATPRDS